MAIYRKGDGFLFTFRGDTSHVTDDNLLYGCEVVYETEYMDKKSYTPKATSKSDRSQCARRFSVQPRI